MNDIDSIIAELILKEIQKYTENISDEKTRAICNEYSGQVVPLLVKELHSDNNDFSFLTDTARQQIETELRNLKPQINSYAAQCLFAVLHKTAEKVPDERAKALLEGEIYQIASSGINSFIEEESWNAAVDEITGQIKDKSVKYAESVSHQAIEKAKQYLPENEYTLAVCDDADVLAGDIIQAAANGGDVEAVCHRAAQQAKERLTKYGTDYINAIAEKSIKEGAKRLHVSGKGSRKINNRINDAAGTISDSLTGHITDNVVSVVYGEKDIGEAAKDIAVGTAKDSAANYMQKHGAELAAEAIDAITKSAAKKIANQTAKKAVLSAGAKLANANTLTAIAGGVIDIGAAIKAYMNGEITKSQMLKSIGEQGSNVCLSTVYGTIGLAAGGPVGAAIGSMVGYMASSMLYGAVLTQFDKEDLARARAEQTHAFYEAAIKEMRRQRLEFEQKASELLKNRANAIMAGFAIIDKAVINSDFDGLSRGLNTIAQSFGRELQFTTFKEFDDFMNSDESFVL